MKYDSLFQYITPVIIFFATLLMPGDKSEFLETYTSSEHSPTYKSAAYHELSSKHKGMTWVGKGKITSDQLKPLVNTNVEWVMLIPFSYQKKHNSTMVHMANDNSYYWGESDEGIIATAHYAKEKGLKTLLKPHVWLIDMSDGLWRGKIAMDSQQDWDAWFRSYEHFILYYARMAEEHGFDAFCVGTELHQAAVLQENAWRNLIREVRKVYSGELTYAANWMDEYEEITFWDALDYIGIQAYFPLTKNENPSTIELVRGWQPHHKRIKAIHSKFNRPVLFTEIGYKSTSDAAIRPWEWPSSNADRTRKVSLETQNNAYDAFFRVFWHEPWFAGAYFWDWYPNHDKVGGRSDKAFTPQNKPAEMTLRDWYARK